MKTVRRLALFTLGILLPLGISNPIQAQEKIPDPAQGVERTLSTRAGDVESQRSNLLGFLDREEVRATARLHGIDLEEVRAAVQTLDSDQLKGLEKQVQNVDDFMAGGDRIVIASSTIIIILLILILVAVA